MTQFSETLVSALGKINLINITVSGFCSSSRMRWGRLRSLISTRSTVGRWSSLQVGVCRSSTKTATWPLTCTPEITAPSLTSATCCRWSRSWSTDAKTRDPSHLVYLRLVILCFSCQTKVHGKDRVKFMESLVVADIEELKDNQVPSDIIYFIHLTKRIS